MQDHNYAIIEEKIESSQVHQRYCLLAYASEQPKGYCVRTFPSDIGPESIRTPSQDFRFTLVCARRQYPSLSRASQVRLLEHYAARSSTLTIGFLDVRVHTVRFTIGDFGLYLTVPVRKLQNSHALIFLYSYPPSFQIVQ